MKKQYGCDVFTNRGIEGGIVLGSVVSFVLEMKNGKPQVLETSRNEAQVVCVRPGMPDWRARSPTNQAPRLQTWLFLGGPRLTDVLGKAFSWLFSSFF